MVLQMARPTRREGSRHAYFRAKVPKHLQAVVKGRQVAFHLSSASSSDDPIIVQVTLGNEVKVSLRTSDPLLIKRRHSEVATQLSRHYEALQQGPRPVSAKDAQWLAGLIYKAFAEGGEDDPGSPAVWQRVTEANEEALKGPEVVLGIYESEAEGRKAGQMTALERRFGKMTDALLAAQGFHTDAASRLKVMEAVAVAANQAAAKLKRNADGDYRPDPDADRFPVRRSTVATGSSSSTVPALSVWSIFERWKQETRPAPSTISTFRGHLKRAAQFFGHDDLKRLTKADVVAWKDAMVAEGLKSVRTGPLATLKTMCAYAVQNGALDTNPALDVKVRQKARAGEGRRDFTTEEVHDLLRRAAAETNPNIKWLIWLQALSGARISEPAQLRGLNIDRRRDYYVMHLKPSTEDGGTFKNAGSDRFVPIHSALIEAGFLEFKRTRCGLPLFYQPRREGWDQESKHPSKGLANRAAQWVREQGYTDLRLGPTHSLRHWFKSECLRLGQIREHIDAVQGQAPRSSSDGYVHVTLEDKRKVVESIVVPPDIIEAMKRSNGK